jgi:hypothetical protein
VEAAVEGRGFLRDCLVVAVDMSRCWFELYQDSPSSPITIFKMAKKGSKLRCWLSLRYLCGLVRWPEYKTRNQNITSDSSEARTHDLENPGRSVG